MPKPLFATPSLNPNVILGATGPAGGDLTGSYPDPLIAPGKVTQEKIADLAVSDVKIAGVAWAKIINPPTNLPPGGNAGGVLTGTYPNPGMAPDAVLLANCAQETRNRLTPVPTMPADQSKVLTVDTSGFAQWMPLTAAQIPDGSIQRIKLAPDVTLSLPPVPTAGNALQIVTVNAGGTGLMYAAAPPASLLPGQVTTVYLGDAPNGVTAAKLNDLAVSTAKLQDGAVQRAKTAADLWLPPIPVAGDVSKVLTVTAGPLLAWQSVPVPPPAVTVGATAPASPVQGQMWWRSDPDGNLYLWYNDGTSSQWVPAMASVGTINGPAGGDLLGSYPNPTINPTKLPWSVSGATLTPTDATKIVAIPGSTTTGEVLRAGTRTIKHRMIGYPTADGGYFTTNAALNASTLWVQDDTAKPSWLQELNASSDSMRLYRIPAGSSTPAALLTLSGNGEFRINSGSGAVTSCLSPGLSTWLWANALWGVTQEDPSKPSWGINLNGTTDQFTVARRAAGGASGGVNFLTVNALGDVIPGRHLFASGELLQCGSGVTKAQIDGTSGQATLNCNNMWGPQDPSKCSWQAQCSVTSDGFYISRRAPGAGNGVATNVFLVDAGGNISISGGTAYKASGTTWANPSDRRLKDSIEDYPTGLAAVVQLLPRIFVYNGKGGSQAGMRGYGFIADEVMGVMDDMVGSRRGKLSEDDEDETEISTLDQSNLILALVNAVKELADRVAALEAR